MQIAAVEASRAIKRQLVHGGVAVAQSSPASVMVTWCHRCNSRWRFQRVTGHGEDADDARSPQSARSSAPRTKHTPCVLRAR